MGSEKIFYLDMLRFTKHNLQPLVSIILVKFPHSPILHYYAFRCGMTKDFLRRGPKNLFWYEIKLVYISWFLQRKSHAYSLTTVCDKSCHTFSTYIPRCNIWFNNNRNKPSKSNISSSLLTEFELADNKLLIISIRFATSSWIKANLKSTWIHRC